MSEYQRYEFMTVDQPLTRTQLDAVNKLSSHIDASPAHAEIEYHWGDFKHDPINVLYQFFDGFLYWANWGSPQFALRFPHGILPRNLLMSYDCDDLMTFSQHKDYDILDIHFSGLEAPDEWVAFDLGSLIAIRQELMDGDLRALYIAWLAAQYAQEEYGLRGYYHGYHGTDDDFDDEDDEGYEDYEDDEETEEDARKESSDGAMHPDRDEDVIVPDVPPALGTLTAAQQALVTLLQLPQELLTAAARHSGAATPALSVDEVAARVEQLSTEQRIDYLVRLVRNEPGLSRKLIKELSKLKQNANQDQSPTLALTAERVTFKQLQASGKAIKTELERQRRERERLKREQERLAYQDHLRDVHAHVEGHWRQINAAVEHSTSTRYDDAVRLLVELREVAELFNEQEEFQTRFQSWIPAYTRRPALITRLKGHGFL